MTSPVDTSVKFFYSGMPGAPVLSSVAGSMTALLDACLVNGFGTLSLTSLTVSNGVATAAFPTAFAATPEAVVLISGVTGSKVALNGEQKVTAIGGGTFSFATAVANGAAEGAISVKMSPVGWGQAFAPGTNTRVYRSNDLTGSMRPFLRVVDTNALVARMTGYETMTSLTAGTGLFPTAAQLSGGQHWLKGYSTATGEVINWTLIGNGKRFQLWLAYGMSTNYGNSTYDGELGHMFGEFNSLKSAADAYNAVIMGGAAASGLAGGGLAALNWNESSVAISIARLHTNAAGARIGGYGLSAPTAVESGGQGVPYGPLNGAMARLMLQQPLLWVDLPTYGPRGYLKEIFHIPQVVPSATVGFAKGDISVGQGIAAGRKLMAVPGVCYPAPSVNATALIRSTTLVDVTGPWE